MNKPLLTLLFLVLFVQAKAQKQPKVEILKATHDSLFFTDTAIIELTDSYGQRIIRLESWKLYVGDLKPGAYYLDIGKNSTQFVRKPDGEIVYELKKKKK